MANNFVCSPRGQQLAQPKTRQFKLGIEDMHATPNVFILAADHFDEAAVVVCLSELRGQGLTAVLVSATPGLLSGKRGIILRPDLSLAQINEFTVKEGQMVLIAGGAESAAAILTDPRAHHLLQQVLVAKGYIAVMRDTCHYVEGLGLEQLRDRNRLLRQGGEETAVFTRRLIMRIST